MQVHILKFVKRNHTNFGIPLTDVESKNQKREKKQQVKLDKDHSATELHSFETVNVSSNGNVSFHAATVFCHIAPHLRMDLYSFLFIHQTRQTRLFIVFINRCPFLY